MEEVRKMQEDFQVLIDKAKVMFSILLYPPKYKLKSPAQQNTIQKTRCPKIWFGFFLFLPEHQYYKKRVQPVPDDCSLNMEEKDQIFKKYLINTQVT